MAQCSICPSIYVFYLDHVGNNIYSLQFRARARARNVREMCLCVFVCMCVHVYEALCIRIQIKYLSRVNCSVVYLSAVRWQHFYFVAMSRSERDCKMLNKFASVMCDVIIHR